MSTRGPEKAGGVAHLNSGDRGDLSDSLLPFEEPPLRGSSQTLGEGPAWPCLHHPGYHSKAPGGAQPHASARGWGGGSHSEYGGSCVPGKAALSLALHPATPACSRRRVLWSCPLPQWLPRGSLMLLRTWGPTRGTLLSSPGVPRASSPPRTSSQVDSRLQDLGLNQHHLEPITPPWV